MANRSPLHGKVAIVTGGGRGIGFMVADAFANAGARVMIADIGTSLAGEGDDVAVAREAAAQIRAGQKVCSAVAADVSDPVQADRIVSETLDQFGDVDILVNVAGILRKGSVLECTDDDWNATFRVHVGGTRHTTAPP